MSMHYRIGRFEVDAQGRQLRIDARAASIGARAFDLLLALIERRDRMVSKHELLDLVWPGLVVEENNLQVHVSTLRKLLGTNAIATIPGRGYRFTLPVDGDAAGGSSATAADVHAAMTSIPETARAAQQHAKTLPGNLPPLAPKLFGRDDAVLTLQTLIGVQSLVTIAGAGGMGKTSLARVVSVRLREQFPDGVWWIDLTPVVDPAQVPLAVATALRLTLAGEGSVQQQLADALTHQSALLVLDNCEQVIEAAAALAEALLDHAAGLHLLATSREPLHIHPEHVYRISPLELPPVGTLAHDREFSALHLFAERARAVEPRFTLDASNAEAVADICRRLDGMPLAIELAAARVPTFGVDGVRNALSERFRLLTTGARNAPRRQQTLHATLDWSHALLSDGERAVFRRLGVFVGGFTLDLAQHVAIDERLDRWAVLDGLSALVDKSLVVADPGEPMRYRLLETTRTYALENLAEAGETAASKDRHARALADLFEQTWEEQYHERAPLGPAAARRIQDPELDNALAALDWVSRAEEAADASARPVPGEAIILAAGVARLLHARGQSQAGLRSMQAWIDRIDDDADPVRAAWFWSAFVIFGDSGRAPGPAVQSALSRAEKIWRRTGNRRHVCGILCSRAYALHETGHHREADAVMAEILALEDPAWPAWVRARRVNAQLLGAMLEPGRLEEALQLEAELQRLRESDPAEGSTATAAATLESLIMLGLERFEAVLEIADALEDRVGRSHPDTVRWTLAHRTFALMFLDRIDEATAAMRGAIDAWRRDGLLLRYCGHLALLVAEQGRYADAARVDGAAEAHMARSGMVPDPSVPLARKRLEQRFGAAMLDPRDIERWRREGEALDEAALMRLCLGT